MSQEVVRIFFGFVLLKQSIKLLAENILNFTKMFLV